jgi:bifunctional non-homologous end joining protein LigD
LSLEGKNTYGLTLVERKELLKKALGKSNIIRYSEHVKENGIDFFNAAKKNDLEGIMAKKADSEYQPGIRTNDWLKIKHHKSEDVVIAGFTNKASSYPITQRQ